MIHFEKLRFAMHTRAHDLMRAKRLCCLHSTSFLWRSLAMYIVCASEIHWGVERHTTAIGAHSVDMCAA